eukprot:TRINITY_DN56431_c0_g1_i1.p1 TRINITY_DN56431_c0_g1~~TRINITY_DN56431_c0_g1_i1.p1  ORF type:complete len:281 (+),score=69.27 TRINITY_DN56431_c0_g1_i1:71-913(+)
MRSLSRRLWRAWFVLVVLRLALGEEEDAEAFDDQNVNEDSLSSDQLRRLHGHMDVDGDGGVSWSETIVHAKTATMALALKDVEIILDAIDLTKDRKLSLHEHLEDVEHQADGSDDNAMELEERARVETAKFRAADTNKDEHLEPHELIGLFYPETHEDVLSVVVQETMRVKDKDRDGRLSPEEFWEVNAVVGDEERVSLEETVEFGKLDQNHDGFLSSDEIRIWDSGAFHLNTAMERLFEVADLDADKRLTADELVNARSLISLEAAHDHFIEWAEHHEL